MNAWKRRHIDIGCGNAMPPADPGGELGYTAADKTCLEAMVQAFASGGPWRCGLGGRARSDRRGCPS